MSDDLKPTGRARGRARGRGVTTQMGDLTLGGGVGRGSLMVTGEEKKPGKGRGEPGSQAGSGGSSSNQSTLSSPHASQQSSSSSEGKIISLGRAPTRGMRERPPSQMVLWTKPAGQNKKQGAGGSDIDLLTNYFSLVQKPNWSLYQYAVTFKPDLEDSRVSYSEMASFSPGCNVVRVVGEEGDALPARGEAGQVHD